MAWFPKPDSRLESRRRQPKRDAARPEGRYAASADPVTRGTTGQRSFYTDQTGIIRFDPNGAATADSPPLELACLIWWSSFRRGRFGGNRNTCGDVGLLGRLLPWFPSRATGRQQPRDQLRVQRMAGFVRHDARLQRTSDQGQVADQIERLVPAEFVGEAQRAVQDCSRSSSTMAFSSEPPRIRPMACSPAKSCTKPKVRAGASSRLNDSRSTANLDFLRAHGRVVVVDKAVHAEIVRRIDADAAVAVGKFQRLQHADVAPPAAQSAACRPARSMSMNGFDDPSRIGSSSASSST